MQYHTYFKRTQHYRNVEAEKQREVVIGDKNILSKIPFLTLSFVVFEKQSFSAAHSASSTEVVQKV